MADIYKDNSPLSAAKTANYQVIPSDIGKVLTNSGASGAVTFTLPALADVWQGWNVEIFIVADQAVTITAPTGKLVAFNNAAATSLAFSTLSEKIGAGAKVFYDAGVGKYLAFVSLGSETQTPTVS